MTILFFILIIITCGVLAFFVLIQNPKGGGLAGSFGGLGNQMMGAKQSTDVVEKGTWVAASVLLALTLLSFMLAPKTKTDINQKTRSETVGLLLLLLLLHQHQLHLQAMHKFLLLLLRKVRHQHNLNKVQASQHKHLQLQRYLNRAIQHLLPNK
jgi:preprotein translocase subunit SecG